MPTPDLLQQDGLTLDERFFARIAVKNGLLSEADLALATRERVTSGRALPEVLKGRGLLTEAQIGKVREAQIASQVVRIDSLYADILVRGRLVPRSTIEEAFAEQRRRRYKVRIGDLLVANKTLSVEGHKAVLDALLKRVTEDEPQTGSTVEGRAMKAEELSNLGRLAPQAPPPPPAPPPAPPPPAPPPPPAKRPPSGRERLPVEPRANEDPEPAKKFDPDSTSETALLARAPRAKGIPRTVTVDPPEGASFLESNAKILGARGMPKIPKTGASPVRSEALSEDDEQENLLASALELRLSSVDDKNELREDDKKRVAEDYSRVDSNAAPVLARVARTASSEPGEDFSPDRWLQKNKGKKRLARRLGLACGFLALGGLAAAAAVAVNHRAALTETENLLAAADKLASADAARAFAQARDRLAQAHGFGVLEQRWLVLEARITTGEARAIALAALDVQDPKSAQAALQSALQHVPADDDEDRRVLLSLLNQADKAALVAAGNAAEERRDWRTAVDCFRTANAEAAQQRVRKRMSDDLQELKALALKNREKPDRDALASALKLYFEIWNDPIYQGLLDDVDFQLALRSAQEALAAGDTARAVEQARRALKLREGDAEANAVLERAIKRQDLDRLLDKARSEARDSRLEEAARDFEEALRSASGDERKSVEGELAAVKSRLGELEVWKKLLARRREVVELGRAGDWDGVIAKLPELERLGEKETARVRSFAQRAKGMSLVPAGPCELGSDDLTKDSKHLIRPKKVQDVPGFLMDTTEVTNRSYAEFVKATGHATPTVWKDNLILANGQPAKRNGEVQKTFPPGEDRHPVTGITWQDATDFATWAGKRLPQDAEWEKAARGTKGQKYPWGAGDEPPPDIRINSETYVKAAPCGDSKSDVSPFKVRDMAGNVAEWCSDAFPTQDGKKHRIIRGSSFRKRVQDARGYAREEGDEKGAWEDVGFRSVLELTEAPAWLADELK